MFEIIEDDNKSVFFTSYTTVMSIVTSDAWISNAMQMLMQTSTELYNHTINVALLTSCIVREDEKRSYDPYQVVLGALLHDIGYAGTINKSRGKPVDEMTDMEKLLFDNHIRLGIDYVEKYTSSQIVKDIIAMHHEYLDGSGLPAHLDSDHIPKHVRIITVVNEFVNQISNETQRFSLDSLSNTKGKMNALIKNGKIDAEILEVLYKRFGEISGLLESIKSFFYFNEEIYKVFPYT